MKTEKIMKLSPDGLTVSDGTTGLTWQQSGSPGEMTYIVAEKYVEGLNAENFAGHSDWRLPTRKESMTILLLQPVEGFYCDQVFDRQQQCIWTVDKESAGRAWAAFFDFGHCCGSNVAHSIFVRAVRFGKMKSLPEFIQQLEKVAIANNDEFSYSFIVVPSRGRKNFFSEVSFIVTETTDGYEILSGGGATIEEASETAQAGWQECLRDFGYEIKGETL
jgi:hypothetical protein